MDVSFWFAYTVSLVSALLISWYKGGYIRWLVSFLISFFRVLEAFWMGMVGGRIGGVQGRL